MLTLALKIGKWLAGGSALSAIAVAALAASGGFVGGYLKGYAKADRAAEVRSLSATVAALQDDIARRKDADALAAELAANMAETEARNVGVSRELESIIAVAPAIAGCVSGAFLERLRRLQ
jgi:succinate dehydrogenase/fumarate reductase flavoprotein subunit